MTECAGRIAHSLEDFSFGDIDGHGLGNSKGEGKIPFNIKVFEGNPKEFENRIKQIEKHNLRFKCNDRINSWWLIRTAQVLPPII